MLNRIKAAIDRNIIGIFLGFLLAVGISVINVRAQVPAVNSGNAQWPTSGAIPVYMAATTVSIGGALLVAGTCSTGTVSVSGATTSMAVAVSPATWPGDGTNITAYVSAPGVVTVKVCAIIALTPASTTYNIRVIQ